MFNADDWIRTQVSEATALPTEPQQLPFSYSFQDTILFMSTNSWNIFANLAKKVLNILLQIWNKHFVSK